MRLLLASDSEDYTVHKVLAAARLAGIRLGQPVAVQQQLQALHPLAQGMALETAEGHVAHHAILRYIAEVAPAAYLYGRSDFQQAEVDNWLDFSWTEVEVCLQVLANVGAFPEANVEQAHASLEMSLSVVNEHLATRTYMVGQHITLADVALACACFAVSKVEPTAVSQQKFVHLFRWMMTVATTPEVRDVIDPVAVPAVKKAPIATAAQSKAAVATTTKPKSKDAATKATAASAKADAVATAATATAALVTGLPAPEPRKSSPFGLGALSRKSRSSLIAGPPGTAPDLSSSPLRQLRTQVEHYMQFHPNQQTKQKWFIAVDEQYATAAGVPDEAVLKNQWKEIQRLSVCVQELLTAYPGPPPQYSGGGWHFDDHAATLHPRKPSTETRRTFLDKSKREIRKVPWADWSTGEPHFHDHTPNERLIRRMETGSKTVCVTDCLSDDDILAAYEAEFNTPNTPNNTFLRRGRGRLKTHRGLSFWVVSQGYLPARNCDSLSDALTAQYCVLPPNTPLPKMFECVRDGAAKIAHDNFIHHYSIVLADDFKLSAVQTALEELEAMMTIDCVGNNHDDL